jgi:S-adenosylmethionine hydrolase
VDLAHDIPPGDVRWGALVLGRLAPLLPGAIYLAVVDPGVGTQRAAVAVALADGGVAVGPDNGLLAGVLEDATAAVRLAVPPEASATFHGRDVFAPAAGRLAAGAGLAELGPEVGLADLERPTWSVAAAEPGRIRATVIGVDRFGNLALDARAEHLAVAGLGSRAAVTVTTAAGDARAILGRTFADVPVGGLLLYLDSGKLLSLATRDGSALATLGVGVGAELALSDAERVSGDGP